MASVIVGRQCCSQEWLELNEEPEIIAGLSLWIGRFLLDIHAHGLEQLAQVVAVVGRIRRYFCPVERREQHRRQNCDNRDDHEQLDQGESNALPLSRADNRLVVSLGFLSIRMRFKCRIKIKWVKVLGD